MDFIDPTICKLIALCAVALIGKFWFDYASGRSLADTPYDDDASACDDAPCMPQGPAMLASGSSD